MSEVRRDESLRQADDSPEAPVTITSKPRSRPQETGDPGEVRLTIIKPNGSSGSYTTK